jgi:hypothetical protein
VLLDREGDRRLYRAVARLLVSRGESGQHKKQREGSQQGAVLMEAGGPLQGNP